MGCRYLMNSLLNQGSKRRVTHAYQLRLTGLTIVLPNEDLKVHASESSPGKRKSSPPRSMTLACGHIPSLMSPAKRAKMDIITNLGSKKSPKPSKSAKQDPEDLAMLDLNSDNSLDDVGSPSPCPSPTLTLGRPDPAPGPSRTVGKEKKKANTKRGGK